MDALGALLPTPYDNFVVDLSLSAHLSPYPCPFIVLIRSGILSQSDSLWLAGQRSSTGQALGTDAFELAKVPWVLGWALAVSVLFLVAFRVHLHAPTPR
jgi:hypothetical protein